MRTVVVYKSKTGYTKSYAEWIASSLGCDIKENKGLTIKDIADYDTVILGGGVYAGGIGGLSLIKKNYDVLKHKNLIVWATGSSPGREDEMKKVWSMHFNEEQLNNIRTFYLRGGFDYSALGRGDKFLMNIFRLMLRGNKDLTEDEAGMLKAYDEPVDFRDKDNIRPLLEYVSGLAAH